MNLPFLSLGQHQADIADGTNQKMAQSYHTLFGVGLLFKRHVPLIL